LSFLESVGPKPTNETVVVEFYIKTDKLLQLADLTYKRTVDRFPQVVDFLTPRMWRHIIRLFITRRIEDARFKQFGTKPPAATRVPLPMNIRIPQVIWDSLAAIGIVEDPQSNKVYIPHAVLPPGGSHETYDNDYVEAIAACTGQDWFTSWQKCLEDLESTREQHGPDEVIEEDDMEDVSAELAKAKLRFEIIKKPSKPGTQKYIIDGVLYSVPAGIEPDAQELAEHPDWRVSQLTGFDDGMVSIDHYRRRVFELKDIAQRYKPQASASYTPSPQMVLDTDQDIGAYGRHLGWSPELWARYDRFTTLVESSMLMSLSWLNDVTGTMASVMPTETERGSVFSIGPTRLVAPIDFALATIIQTGYWPRDKGLSGWVANWRVKSERLGTRDMIMQQWIEKMFTTPSAVINTFLSGG
jgi:hypothetical protein